MARKNNGAATVAAEQETTAPDFDNMTDEEFKAAAEQMDAEAGNEPAEAEEQPSEEPQKAEEGEKPEAKAEEAKETDDGDDDVDEQSDTVPFKTFDRWRHKAKEAEQRQKALEERFDKLMNMAQQRQEQPQGQQQRQQQERWIDPAVDPAGAIRQRDRVLAQLMQERQQSHQQSQHQEQISRVLSESNQDIQEFIEERPDAAQAIEFLRDSRTRELNAMGFRDPQVQRDDLNNLQIQLTHLAKQNGRRPAELIYDLARERGWQPQKPTAQAEDPTQKIEAVKKQEDTKQRAQSLGGSGAPVKADDGISFEDFSNMSDAQLDALAADLAKQGKTFEDVLR